MWVTKLKLQEIQNYLLWILLICKLWQITCKLKDKAKAWQIVKMDKNKFYLYYAFSHQSLI